MGVDPGDGAGDLDLGGDLDRDTVAAVLPDRPVRVYPALLSTEAEAMSWARRNGAPGSLVVAGYQVSPRGRSGLDRGELVGSDFGIGFSLLSHPSIEIEREGWPYLPAVSGIADVLAARNPDAEVDIVWPDEVHVDGVIAAAVGVHTELGPGVVRWVATTVLIAAVRPPRAALLGEVVTAIEARAAQDPATVIEEFLPRCRTLGHLVRARLLPLGPAGPSILGTAVDVLDDGALVIATVGEGGAPDGHRVAVRPGFLGHLDDPPQPRDLDLGRRPT